MRAPPKLVLIVAAVAALFFGAHYYLADRLVLEPTFGDLTETVLLVLISLGALILLGRIVGRWLLGLPLPRATAWIAYFWMGFAWILLVATAASDVVLLLAWPLLPEGGSGTVATARALVVWAVALAATGVAIVTAFRFPRVRRVEFALSRWPGALDGFRILQLSDIHVGPLLRRPFVERLVEQVNALDPDLVALTGDLVDGEVDELARDVEPISGLRARFGVFSITGNHDYLSGVEPWVEHVTGLGVRLLRNARVSIGNEGARFELAGVDDHHGRMFGGSGEDLERALAGRDDNLPLVLLAHQPNTFPKAAAMGVDLQLSGHTHGGQIWPFGYLIHLLYTRYVAGRFEENGAQLYVSRGTGFWGPPMRLFAPAEITEIVLRSAKAA